MPQDRKGQTRRLVLLLWVLVAIFYFYLSYDYIRVAERDREFGEYVQHVAQIAGNGQHSTKDVRDLLLVKAQELSLPVTREQIEIRSGASGFDIAVKYDVDIEIPLLQRQIYHKQFQHNAKYQPPR